MSTQTSAPAAPSAGYRLHNGTSAGGGRPHAADIIRVGLVVGAVAGMMMAMWQMVVGAVADEPTAVPRISSSPWTAVTATPSVLFGIDCSTRTSSSGPWPSVSVVT